MDIFISILLVILEIVVVVVMVVFGVSTRTVAPQDNMVMVVGREREQH